MHHAEAVAGKQARARIRAAAPRAPAVALRNVSDPRAWPVSGLASGGGFVVATAPPQASRAFPALVQGQWLSVRHAPRSPLRGQHRIRHRPSRPPHRFPVEPTSLERGRQAPRASAPMLLQRPGRQGCPRPGGRRGRRAGTTGRCARQTCPCRMRQWRPSSTGARVDQVCRQSPVPSPARQRGAMTRSIYSRFTTRAPVQHRAGLPP